MIAALLLAMCVPDDPSTLSTWAQERVEAFRAKHQLPAAGLTIWTGDELVQVVTGTTRLGGDVPVEKDSVWHIGSNGKAITGLLAGTLVDEGKIRFETKLGEVAPEFKDSAYAEVTLWDFLSHHSGLRGDSYYPGGDWHTPRDDWRSTRIELLKKATAVAPTGGREFLYSNMNFVAAGIMIEKAGGKSFEALIEEKVCKPLKIKIEFGGAPVADARHPWPHYPKTPLEVAKATPWGAAPDNGQAIAPAGCMAMSGTDHVKLLRVFVDKGKPLIKPETYTKLTTAREPKASYGGGWICVQRAWAEGTVLTHTGSNTMNTQAVWVAPGRRWIVIVSTNATPSTAGAGVNELAGEVLRKLGAT